jgi:tetratricopeptide (TPR) repeat protein
MQRDFTSRKNSFQAVSALALTAVVGGAISGIISVVAISIVHLSASAQPVPTHPLPTQQAPEHQTSAQQTSEQQIFVAKKYLDDGITRLVKSPFVNACSTLQKVVAAEPNNQMAMYYLSYAQQWAVIYGMTRRDPTLIAENLEQGILNGERLVKARPDWAEPKVVLSTLYGLKVTINKLNALTYGMKVESLINEALKLAPDNPRVLYVHGNSYFHKPGIFGGSAKKALEVWARGAALYEREAKDRIARGSTSPVLEPDWGQMETYAWLGQCYEYLGDYKNAQATYKRALTVNPAYTWIRDELLPALEKRM